MVGNKVVLSIGVTESGIVIINDKRDGSQAEYPLQSIQATEIKALVKEEYQSAGQTIPPHFLLAFTL
jgi:hypothetical protein